MSSDAVSKLTQMDYIMMDNPNIENLPPELYPTALTEDGIFIETLPNDESVIDGLFVAYGKLIVVKKFLLENNLNRKYSILLLLSNREFKQIHPELRKSIFDEIPIIIV
ncbi:MAG: hypothetical protein INQ03_21920 [Candidatus Heimdallarchaeota archaeon]|nr:hypothetical protein [Candidatus Heimdallarchaeota archaeon]